MSSTQVEELVRLGEIDQAAALAQARGHWKRAAELLASVGKSAEAVICAARGAEWRLAMDVALTSGDEPVIAALAVEIGRDAGRAATAAAQARLARRDDVAGMLLESTAPAEAARCWYARGDYARAARCFTAAGDVDRAMRAWEQHLAQTPEDVEAAVTLADLRAARGDDPGAVRALQTAVRAGAGPEAMGRLVCGLARLGYDQGARDWVLRLRRRDPSHPLEVEAYRDRLPRGETSAQRYAGRYRVVREVGSGATGRVLEAVDELTGDPVALKVLTVSDDRGGAFARFMREAELARSIEDPTLVRLRALDPEGPTMVYDWMPGGTLADRMARLSLREVRSVALRLLAALETLHRNGVVHRDVKPSNVLFDPAGQARLGDLGAAHLGDLGATVTGGMVGSLPYMAPEQVTGAPVSAATDFYALGCVLFQCITGRLPFAGPDFVAQHLGDPPPHASDLREGLPEAFDRALEALLAKDSEARPQDATAARALLTALPWDQADDALPAVTARRSSIPAAAADEGGRLVPSVLSAGRWTDEALGRDVERVRLRDSSRGVLARWAASGATELQPVYDMEDDGDDGVVAWVEPLAGVREYLSDQDPGERVRLAALLAAVGVTPGDLHAVRLARDGGQPVLELASALGAVTD